MQEIGNYEVVINEGNARVAIIINEEENVLELIKDKTLEYFVNFENEKIYIFIEQSETPLLVFKNANKELLKYAYKSNGIPLVIGTVKTAEPIIIYETYVMLR